FMNIFRQRVFSKYPDAKITYGAVTTPHRIELGLKKSNYNDAIAATNIQCIKGNTENIFYIKQFRKKKRSLHEINARKWAKNINRAQKRSSKNTKYSKGIHKNDYVETESGFR